MRCTRCCSKKQDGPNSLFDNEITLVVLDKLSKGDKLNPSYKHIDEIFAEISLLYKQQNVADAEKKDDSQQNTIIMDIGCGTGNHIEILCKTFLSDNNIKDKLICLDYSVKAIEFAKNRTIQKNKYLQTQNIEFIQTKHNSLCLTSQYDSNAINLCLMAYVMHHISMADKSRDLILKEIYKCLKPNGLFVVFDFGVQFMKSLRSGHGGHGGKHGHHGHHGHHGKHGHHHDQHGHGHHGHHQHHHGHGHGHGQHGDDKKKNENDALLEKKQQGMMHHNLWENCDELVKYVESFGFKFLQRILENVVDTQWIVVFVKS